MSSDDTKSDTSQFIKEAETEKKKELRRKRRDAYNRLKSSDVDLLVEFEAVEETFGSNLALTAQNYLIEILKRQNEI